MIGYKLLMHSLSASCLVCSNKEVVAMFPSPESNHAVASVSEPSRDLNSISFEKINVSHLFRNNELAKDRACLMDLRCLCEKTDFLHGTAFVRGEIQTLFKQLCEKKAGKKHILIGSAGVGKSIVFFLAALSLSAVQRKQVTYSRWDNEKPTVFLMKPGPSEGFC
jgi:hypothetical protein